MNVIQEYLAPLSTPGVNGQTGPLAPRHAWSIQMKMLYKNEFELAAHLTVPQGTENLDHVLLEFVQSNVQGTTLCP